MFIKKALVRNQILLRSKSVIIWLLNLCITNAKATHVKVNYQITSQKCNIYKTSIFVWAEIRTFQLKNIDVYTKSINEGWEGGWNVYRSWGGRRCWPPPLPPGPCQLGRPCPLWGGPPRPLPRAAENHQTQWQLG